MVDIKAGEIVRRWLVEHGFDGLCYEDCGCGIKDNLFPCVDCFKDCVPAYEHNGTDNCPYDCRAGCFDHSRAPVFCTRKKEGVHDKT